MPGTFRPAADNDGTQQSTEEYIATVDSVSTIVTTEIESTTEVSIFAVGGTFFFTMISVGGGIIFGFIIIIVCILIGFSVRRKRKSQAFITDTTLQTNNGIQMQDGIYCMVFRSRFSV